MKSLKRTHTHKHTHTTTALLKRTEGGITDVPVEGDEELEK